MDSDVSAFGSAGSETQMGSVMGTPAYMPPEQALGEIDNMDERADENGLGAILCQILTGQPPYVAEDGTRVFRMASRGKLEDAFSRLDACGADEDLIALTRHCLELEPVDRPRDAGVLAERVTGYLESVEAKLRDAEVQRATEAARLEQQKHSARKLGKMLGGLAVVALVALLACVAALVLRGKANRLAAEALVLRDKAHASANEALVLRDKANDLAAQADADREIAERHRYHSTIRLAESMLQGEDQARFRVADVLWGTQARLRGWEWGYLMGRCPLEQWSFQASEIGLATLAASKDGRYLATGSLDGTVSLWDVSSHKTLWSRNIGRPRQIEFDPRNRYFAIVFLQGSSVHLQLLDLPDGRVVHEEQGSRVRIAFGASSDLYIVRWEKEEIVKLLRMETESWSELEHVLLPELGLVNPSYQMLFVDTEDQYLGLFCGFGGLRKIPLFRFFDARTLAPVAKFGDPNEFAPNTYSRSVPILNSKNSEVVFSAVDRVVRRSLDNKKDALLTEFPSRIEHLAMDEVTGAIVAANGAGLVHVVREDTQVVTFSHGAPIVALTLLPGGRILTGGADGLVKCWPPGGPAALSANKMTAYSRFPTPAAGNSVAFANGDQRVLFRTWERDRHFWLDVNSLDAQVFPRDVVSLKGPQYSEFRPGTSELMVNDGPRLDFFDFGSPDPQPQKIRTLEIPSGQDLRCAAFDGRGRYLVCSTVDDQTLLFDLETGTPRELPKMQIVALAVDRGGTRFAVLTQEDLQVRSLATGEMVNRWELPQPIRGKVVRRSLAFNPDGSLIALVVGRYASEYVPPDDSLVRLWDVSRGKMLPPIKVNEGAVLGHCRFTNDGQRVLTGEYFAVRVWDWRIGKELLTLPRSQGCANSIAQSPGGLVLGYTGWRPNLILCRALPWQFPRDENFYRAVEQHLAAWGQAQ